MRTRTCQGAVLTAAAASLAAAAGCARVPEAATARAQDAAAPVIARVATVTPQRATVRKVSREPGQLEGFEVTSLFAKVAGYVETLSVDIGDTIRKGQVIAVLDVPELQAEVEQKRAGVAQATAETEQAEAAVTVAEAAVASAQARVEEVRAAIRRTDADVVRWQAEHGRTAQLVRDRAVIASVLDEAQSKLEAAGAARDEAAARVHSANAAIAQARAEQAKARADVTAARARVTVAQADLRQAEALAGYTRITAPFDGVITRRYVHTGHLTVPGGPADPLFVAARIDRLRIVVGVPEVDAPFVNPGDRAEIRLQALNGRTFEGKVARTSWSLEQATRTLRTEIDLDNPNGMLRPGLYAYVTIVADEHPGVLVVPAAAVVREGEKAYCVTVEAGKARRREVRLGLSDAQGVEIVSGLDAGQSVVTANAASLADGQAVQVEQPATK